MTARSCQFCGAEFATVSAGVKRITPTINCKRFCSTACKRDFNNLRATRGAELYDLFRAMRRERETAKDMDLWTQMCRLETRWQEEDDHARPGRKSYMPPRDALMKLVDAGRISRHMTPAQVQEDATRRAAASRAAQAVTSAA